MKQPITYVGIAFLLIFSLACLFIHYPKQQRESYLQKAQEEMAYFDIPEDKRANDLISNLEKLINAKVYYRRAIDLGADPSDPEIDALNQDINIKLKAYTKVARERLADAEKKNPFDLGSKIIESTANTKQ